LGVAGLFLGGLVHLTCNQAILTAPAGSEMLLFANPPFIASHGDVSVISVVVTESIGTPVADGTVVLFVTTLGSIQEQAKTNDGVARVNLVSDSRAGTATVTAFSGGVSGELSVDIGTARPASVFITAYPTRLTDRRASRIVATVIDVNGNPIQNIPVLFTVALPRTEEEPSDEFMESRGSPVFTDNNGQAIDIMRTRYPFGAPVREVRVTATVLTGGKTGISATVSVTIN